MSEVLERAAAAAYGHFFCDDWPPKQAPDLGMEADAWREAVRKAIAAIRMPTQAMRHAGAEVDQQWGYIEAVWEAMIDEALK